MESRELIDYVSNHQKPTFHELLFHFIDQKETSDAAIYKKAGIDRRHFSKIRSNPKYQIGKKTAIALCMALELSRSEEHTSELQSRGHLVCRLLLEKKNRDRTRGDRHWPAVGTRDESEPRT